MNAEISFPARFKQIAALHASNIALAGSDWMPTYAELDAVTDAFASRLLARPGKIGGRAALLMRHDAPLLAGVLSVLKAGKMVVVLNPTEPAERLRQILNDAEPELFITDEASENLAKQIWKKNEGLRFDHRLRAAGGNFATVVAPGDYAWLIYTSGSTGRPKGVIQTHRNIVHNALRLSQGMKLNGRDKIILLASPGSGQGVSVISCALLNGATLCPFPIAEKGAARLAEWMNEKKITVFVSSTSVFRNFAKTLSAETFFADVRVVRLGSEPSTSEDFALFQKISPAEGVLMVSLSSSETGNLTQENFTRDRRVAPGRLPAGRPAAGMEILLWDDQGNEIADGETGEIIVRSQFVSPGYWRNEALTAERFFRGKNGELLFRSGDLGRQTADGVLHFMGRKDARVKIHGYRIEISEIEELLQQQAQVEMAAVSVRATPGDETQLVAHVVPRAGELCTAELLRAVLRKNLPGYMVPAHLIFIEKFPWGPSGKIDREKLKQMPLPVPALSGKPAVTPTEILVARLWQKVFARDFIGRDDEFFDLGGDSLNASVISAEIFAALAVELEMSAFAKRVTVAGLAAMIDGAPRVSKKTALPLVRVPRGVPLPLSFTQERIWKFSQTAQASLGYAMTGCYRITGALDVRILRDSIDFLIRRHEILRTAIEEINGEPAQLIQTAKPMALPVLDLSAHADAEAEATRQFQEEAMTGFDFRRAALLRFKLVRWGENEHWLARFSHHIIADNRSWEIFFRELALVYEAKVRGASLPLPEAQSLQYGDYAARQRSLLRPEGTHFRELIDWWREKFSEPTPALKIPFLRFRKNDRAKPAEGIICWDLDREVNRRLAEISREENATFYATHLAVFSAQWSVGNPATIIGMYVTDRNCVATQNMLGDFSNLVTLRLACDHAKTFRAWLRAVQKNAAETQAHASLPYKLLCEEMAARGVTPPGINVLFNLSSQVLPAPFSGLKFTWLNRLEAVMPWGFSMTLDPQPETLNGRVTFDARIYHPARVRKWLEHFQRLLRAVSENPDRPVGELLSDSKEKSFFQNLFRR